MSADAVSKSVFARSTFHIPSLQCFDTVGCMTRRSSGLQKSCIRIKETPKAYLEVIAEIRKTSGSVVLFLMIS